MASGVAAGATLTAGAVGAGRTGVIARLVSAGTFTYIFFGNQKSKTWPLTTNTREKIRKLVA